MKNLIVTCIATGVAIMSSFAADSVLNLPGPAGREGSDFESPLLNSRTAPVGIPTSVASAAIGLATNFNFRIVRGSEVTVTANIGNALTNATGSNAVIILQTSPDGRTWATASPINLTHANIASSTASIRQWTIPQTNFGVNAYGRVYGITNQGSTGNGSIFPSNITVTTWRKLQVRE